MLRFSSFLLVLACCPSACGGSVSGNDSKLDASIFDSATTDTSSVFDSSETDSAMTDSGKLDTQQDSTTDVSHPCPSNLLPEGPCPSEGQSCANHGCSSGQSSDLTCMCSNQKWMCAALSCPDDAASDVDPITAFVNQMNGIWLVGASGGMNHYSWVRIRSEKPGAWTGTAEFLAGDDLAINSPFWPCSGLGSFFIPAKPNSIVFTFPSSCPKGLDEAYTFDFQPVSSYPNGAIQAATVSRLSGSDALDGFKFPDSQCNDQMTTCIDPLQ